MEKANWINQTHFCYTCKYCFTRYRKDGTPSLRAKNVIHFHGSCGDLSNRIEQRISPCGRCVDIVIDDSTLRK